MNSILLTTFNICCVILGCAWFRF